MSVKQKHHMDMLNGSLWNKILIFALPLAASSIMQQLFNSADVAIVGRFVGSDALAAVGSNGPIINLLINIFVGLSIGSNVVISRFIGAGNVNKISRAVHTSIVIAFISGLFVTILGISITRPILRLMSAPENIIDLSALYLRIYFLGIPFQMLYNFSAAILRSHGDTKRPLIALIIAGVVNVILNLILVIIFKLGVAGVAIATAVSEIISSTILIACLIREKGSLHLSFKKLKVDFKILKEIAQIGIPAGLQGMVFSASNVCIQSSINSLGSQVVAASAAALNFEVFVYYMLNAFSQAATTFTGQNYGAGKLQRCSKIMWLCLGLSIICVGIMIISFLTFSRECVSLYTSDNQVLELALIRMKIILPFDIFNTALEILSGCMRGLGYSFVPAAIAIVGICGVRLLWVYTIFNHIHTFENLMAVYPVSWIITASAIFAAYFIVKNKVFKQFKTV